MTYYVNNKTSDNIDTKTLLDIIRTKDKPEFEGRFIYCHPDNLEIIKQYVNKREGHIPHFVHRIYDIQVITDNHIEKAQWNGEWKRSNVLPDDNMTTWIEDIENPPSWAKYFGLVEKALTPVYYVMGHKPETYIKRMMDYT